MSQIRRAPPFAIEQVRNLRDELNRIRGGLTIGDTVIGGTNNRFLYINGSGNIAVDDDAQFDGSTSTFKDVSITGNANIGNTSADSHIVNGTFQFIGDAASRAFIAQPDGIAYWQDGGANTGVIEHRSASGSWIFKNAALTQVTISAAGNWFAAGTSESDNYPLLPKFIIPSMWNGLPESSEDVLRFVAPANCDVTLPAGLSDSKFTAGIAATASTTFTITKNGSSIGSATFAAAATSATFTFSSDVTFSEDHKLQVTAPSSADATLADLSITLKGYRS